MPEPTLGEVEQFARNQRQVMMNQIQGFYVTILTLDPPPSKMPRDVREFMYKMCTRLGQLFAPEAEPTKERIPDVPL